ncbi:MAG: HlyD family type I secretion periplasmic adaptor subunit [Betaproteobacteria bacterium]|nr:HlyD family type I secretion periplasmic adaptor subunit [Betaproteobacteria bacterium]
MLNWLKQNDAAALDFAPAMLRAQQQAPSPLPRLVLYALLVLFGVMLAWAAFGQLDIVAVAPGKIVPQSFLKIVQPAEQGIVREILVKDGDTVQEGQVLIRMDAQLSEADRSVVANELELRELQLRRIDAELAGSTMMRQTSDSHALFVQVEAQHHARRQAYRDALEGERALLVKAQKDLKVALEIEGKLRKTVPIYRGQAEGWERLAKEGFAGKLMAMERQRLYIENEQDLRAQGYNVESLKATIVQSEKRIAQITSNYRQQLQNERVEAAAQRHRLEQELDKHQHRFGLLELKAPHAGVVKDLATRTPGTVVAPGTILLTLVPQNEPLIAEVWVSNADAGFVQLNQKTRLKLAAYPFQKYGMLDGMVRQISADAQERADAATGGTKPLQEAAYRALIGLDANYLVAAGERLRLVPGMLVNAEIHLGTRSVLEYLLSPVRKIAHEAGRER